MLIDFNNFINEKLGILDDIKQIADIVYNELKDKQYYQLKTEYLNKKITIDFYFIKNEKSNIDGSFTVINENFFKIRMNILNKPTIIHELKHMDRYIRKNGWGYQHKLLKSNLIISNNLSFLFKNKNSIILMNDILYYINPDEFESHYNHIYEEIKNLIKDDMNNSEKKQKISIYLNEQTSYFINKYIHLNNIDIRNLFKSEKHCKYFLNELLNNIKNNNKNFKIIRWIKWILNNNKINNKNNIDKMNNYINHQTEKNYKKFNRLYSLFLN